MKVSRSGKRGSPIPRARKRVAAVAASVTRRAKEPSERQYVAMAGAMLNALNRLRVFHQTMMALKPLVEDREVVLLHESEKKTLLSEIGAAADILRIGLKARVRR